MLNNLTPSQAKTVNSIKTFLPNFNILVVKGETGIGKDYALSTFFRDDKNYNVVSVDICKLCQNLNHKLNAQDLIQFLDDLYPKQEHASDDEPSQKRLRLSNVLHNIIYIRRLDKIFDVTTDFHSETRFLTGIIFKRWLERLPFATSTIITSAVKITTPVSSMITIDAEFTKQDIISLLKNNTVFSLNADLVARLSELNRPQNPLQINHCLRYLKSLIPERLNSSDTQINSPNTDNIVRQYRKEYTRFLGIELDVDKEIVQPDPSIQLIGLEKVMNELTSSLLDPFELHNPLVPIPRGIVLVGPSGTGKTTLGRWISHRLKNKFYLFTGSLVNFISSMEELFRKATLNAPAVIFIDDADEIFERPENQRLLLTLLDGTRDYNRNDVCVVVTCLNSNCISPSLIRGGRLELMIKTHLPSSKTIDKMLILGLEKIQKVLKEVKHLDVTCSNISMRSIRGTMETHSWNCADINNCVNIVTRKLLAQDSKCMNENSILDMFEMAITQIRRQYSKCKFVPQDKDDLIHQYTS